MKLIHILRLFSSFMMPGSKGLSPHELAHKWVKDLGTRPDMSIKVGCRDVCPTICEYWGGLWGAERPVDVRLAPTEAEAKTAEHGAIRGHHSWGLFSQTSYYLFTLFSCTILPL